MEISPRPGKDAGLGSPFGDLPPLVSDIKSGGGPRSINLSPIARSGNNDNDPHSPLSPFRENQTPRSFGARSPSVGRSGVASPVFSLGLGGENDTAGDELMLGMGMGSWFGMLDGGSFELPPLGSKATSLEAKMAGRGSAPAQLKKDAARSKTKGLLVRGDKDRKDEGGGGDLSGRRTAKGDGKKRERRRKGKGRGVRRKPKPRSSAKTSQPEPLNNPDPMMTSPSAAKGRSFLQKALSDSFLVPNAGSAQENPSNLSSGKGARAPGGVSRNSPTLTDGCAPDIFTEEDELWCATVLGVSAYRQQKPKARLFIQPGDLGSDAFESHSLTPSFSLPDLQRALSVSIPGLASKKVAKSPGDYKMPREGTMKRTQSSGNLNTARESCRRMTAQLFKKFNGLSQRASSLPPCPTTIPTDLTRKRTRTVARESKKSSTFPMRRTQSFSSPRMGRKDKKAKNSSPERKTRAKSTMFLKKSCPRLSFLFRQEDEREYGSIRKYLGNLNIRIDQHPHRLTEIDASGKKLIMIPKEVRLFASLQTLNLSCNRLTSLPEEICQMKSLFSLNISRNWFVKFPLALSGLGRLYTLDVSQNFLTTISPVIGMMKSLRTLKLDSNALDTLPSAIGNLHELHTLSAARNNITLLPKALGRLSNLKSLNVSQNSISVLPSELQHLSSLLWVDLSGNSITVISGDFGDHSKLTYLNLDDNKIGSLPKRLENLSALESLRIAGNDFTHFPKSLAKSQSCLRSLDIGRNMIMGMPEELFNFRNLMQLSICCSEIKTLPPMIERLTCLEELNLSHNKLTMLPHQISSLSCLRKFNVHDNRITHFPESIRKLRKLKVLNASCNRLTELPSTISGLSSLRSLNIRSNRLESLPLSIGDLGLTSLQCEHNLWTGEFLEQLKKDASVHAILAFFREALQANITRHQIKFSYN